MRHLLTGLSISIFCSALSFAGAADRASMERMRSLTLEGLQFLYNLEVHKATGKFTEAIAVDPSHPRPYVSRAMAPLWKLFVTRSDTDYQEVVQLTAEAIDVAERYLEANGDDADVLTSLGTAYGFRAYAHAVNKSYLKAAWDGKRSYDYLADAVRTDPQFYDAYLGLGLFHFAVSTVPRALRWVAGMLGIDGDRDLGIKEIELAARRAIYNGPEAKYFLVQFYPWYKGDFEASERLIDELLRVYPANAVFLYAKGFLKLRQNNVSDAFPYFLRMRELDNPYLSRMRKFAEFRIGECYFRLSDYARARDAYLEFLALNNPAKRDQFEAVASYHAGLAVEMLGDRGSALPLYLRAKNFDATHGDDVYSARQAARLLSLPLSLVDSVLIAARNFHRRGLYMKAMETYTDLLQSFTLTCDQRAEGVYRMGDCLYDQGNYDQAAEQFRMVLSLTVTSEVWVMPWAHFMLGQIALKKNDHATARKEFELVTDYDTYDHKNWLTFRAEQELERLK